MNSDSTLSVVIAGGGFCGAMTLVNLATKSKHSLDITLINKDYPLAMGIAFQSYSDLHLLNVEARNMSAIHGAPDHFVEWCYANATEGRIREEIPTTFFPRNIYGRYLKEILDSVLQHLPSNIRVHLVDDEVTDIDKKNETLIVKTAEGKQFSADKFVLATGNCEPSPPSVSGKDFLTSRNYFANPWNLDAVVGLNDKDTVLIIGAGLTMVDVIIGLREKNFLGKIISLSPHGYKILPHRKAPPQRYILDELTKPYELETLFHLFYKHIRQARKRGLSGETVVDAIRAKTQEIWQNLTLADKKKFMSHLRHLWGVARHRLPGEIHSQIQMMITEKKLRVIAGRIRNIEEKKNFIEVKIQKRKDQSEKILKVSRIINCTGPETDLRRQKSTLYDNLIEKGIVRADEMRLGIDATATGNVIDANDKISENIFAIGSLLKGKLWESTAIPELRIQAANVAEIILNSHIKKM